FASIIAGSGPSQTTYPTVRICAATSVCAKHKVPVHVITDLVALQRERQHQERAAGINARFEEILGGME
ncbi:DNA modification system-associated small protein, partial [Burkholderia contaminans]|uniref:DNA modification system-associated small protein n=1 Tax=Burkholderia contaminans TaxID=488447 RepID=UPI001C2E191B